MTTGPTETAGFEFYFAKLDTLVWVETSSSEVVIHSTRATFSPAHKACFIRELAAEGFIPEDCAWSASGSGDYSHSVRWQVDTAWLKPNPLLAAQTCRFVLRLIGFAALFWVAMMIILFCRSGA